MRLMKDMTEPELRTYFNQVMNATQSVVPPDVEGFMLVMFTDQGITQYASSVEREDAVEALRELADRLERKDTITR